MEETVEREVLHGTFYELERHGGNIKPGRITIKAHGEFVICDGPAPNIRKNFPVIVEGVPVNQFKNHYIIDKIRFDSTDRSAFVAFFSGRIFSGVGKLKAEHLYDKLHCKMTELSLASFDLLPDPVMMRIFTEEGIKDSVSEILREEIKCLYYREEIYNKIAKFHGNFHDTELLYETYNEKAVKILKESPYTTYVSGVSFSLLDHIGKYLHKPAYDEDRISLIFSKAAAHIEQQGSSCIHYNTFISTVRSIEKTGAFLTLPEELYLAFLIQSKKFKIFEHNDETLIFPAHAFYVESAIAAELYRLQKSAKPTGYTGYKGVRQLDKDQMKAMDLLASSGVKVVTGGPGAGKTTIIQTFIEEYQKLFPSAPFFLCAPTGRAAVRISESSGLKAVTIHKLLGYRPYQKEDGTDTTEFNKAHQFPKGIFIIDEMSMVGENLFLKFLEAVPNDSLVLLSGDPRQLQAVDAGNVLKDIIASELIPVQELTQIHRQKEGSSIIDNYYKIKDKDVTLYEDACFRVIDEHAEDQLLADIKTLRETYETNDPYSFQILTFTKGGNIGKDAINNLIASEKRAECPKNQEKNLYYGKSSFAVGDKIMMTANNYKKGYWNGDVGRITEITPMGIRADFYDGPRSIAHDSFSDMEHAWACTVHKSQGSQYDTVVVVVDNAYENMLYNSIILTAVTRAKTRVIILTMYDAVYRAIRAVAKSNRMTGLPYIMEHKFSTYSNNSAA
jgi:exodeoxyribonuclease V alpha subunit